MNGRARLALAALLLLVGVAGLAWLPVWIATGLAAFGACAGIAAAAFLALAVQSGEAADRRTVAAAWFTPRRVLLLAVLLRLAVVAAPPWLSDDVWRYQWEGVVQRAGFSPYTHAPDDPELMELAAGHGELHARVTHRAIPAVYPPAAQFLFRALPPSALLWRLLLTGVDIGFVAWLLRAVAQRSSRPPAAATLLYAWNPLVILTGAASGHLDALAWIATLPLLATAAVASAGGRNGFRELFAGACAGFAALLKPPALVTLFAFLRRGAPPRRLALLGALAAILLAWLPFRGDGLRLFDGLSRYAHDWEMNALCYPPLVRLAEATKEWLEALPDQPLHLWKVREIGYAIVPNQLGRKLSALLFVAAAALLVTRWRGRALTLAFFVVAAFLATTPTAHPWYLAWLAPFLPFLPRTTGRFALLLTVSTLAAHAVPLLRLVDGGWREPPWVAFLTWLAPCALFAWDCWRGRMAPACADAPTAP
ncbi:MAG: hypothetical protein FJ293_03865 [Planctomycetes bacterium]|nr:hypothetical protein [Planctomycetota bacterium]